MNKNKNMYAISMALHFEPYIIKNKAININNQNSEKMFFEFIQSSSLSVPYLFKLTSNPKTYMHLEEMMKNVTSNSIFKMWGAIELLYPSIMSNINYNNPFGKSFIKTLKNTNLYDVQHLNIARNYKWIQSKKPFKNQYEFVNANTIFEHYEIFQNQNKDNSLIMNWCNEILLGLPCSSYIFSDIKNIDISNLEKEIPLKWILWQQYYPNFTIGQLADFLIIALYKYFYNNYQE